ncbi:FkbM family methyltransferase [Pseudanabaena sp. FACHB-1277]|uniref:FkbM family methyltransferase n=1 Tax=Pseudanabaena cinerea FACHB-1277 TaxID=2949581 RepID=A0A926US89_9CYAN|nr:FkbM family methyltransferase [Pseudanabaena cinerea]MBD2150285.1 FkbM family methyltransferase [Pseudanabaena cinerea FACHB-1277]
MKNLSIKISTLLKSLPLIHNLLRRIYCIFFPGIRFRTEEKLAHLNQVFVLKIGANDGVLNDPFSDFLMFDTRFRGILVEPIPHYAQMLRDNYSDTNRFKVEESAIFEESTSISMFLVDEEESSRTGQKIEPWLRGVASIDKSHVIKHLSSNLHKYVKEIPVSTLTVPDLLSKYCINHIDLLHIDAEGFDYMILRQFDFEEIHPRVVLFECKHLSPADRIKSKELMESHGYSVYLYETDFLCLN